MSVYLNVFCVLDLMEGLDVACDLFVFSFLGAGGKPQMGEVSIVVHPLVLLSAVDHYKRKGDEEGCGDPAWERRRGDPHHGELCLHI